MEEISYLFVPARARVSVLMTRKIVRRMELLERANKSGKAAKTSGEAALSLASSWLRRFKHAIALKFKQTAKLRRL